MTEQIKPHGGKLIHRIITEEKEKKELLKKADGLKKIILNSREISDLEMIATGAFSPLEGFMTKKDYESVLSNNKLKSKLAWTIPITLSIIKEEKDVVKEGSSIALMNNSKKILGLLEIEEVFSYDKKKEAECVYKTTNDEHPGVRYLNQQGELLAGGKITLINRPEHQEFTKYWFDPIETRKIFKEKNWLRVVGFQTRNPVHRAHEFIIKCAMEIVDGLFLNPLVGETKQGDIPAEVRMICYEKLIEKYFPKNRVFMGVYGAAMRYAGPKEAILHAIVRKNFGCTHFIVGRDHAGVGNFYGPFDAQKIFDEFKPEDFGITPLFFENSFYCRHCQEMSTIKTCPHPEDEHFSLSGTKVRELLASGEIPPPEFTRPEIANILIDWFKKEKP